MPKLSPRRFPDSRIENDKMLLHRHINTFLANNSTTFMLLEASTY